jgi:hypothetical protein
MYDGVDCASISVEKRHGVLWINYIEQLAFGDISPFLSVAQAVNDGNGAEARSL